MLQNRAILLLVSVFMCVPALDASPITVSVKSGEGHRKLSEKDSRSQKPVLLHKPVEEKIQNGSSFKAQHDNDEYLEKKGGDGETVYVTKYHRAGTGGYNHYEAFHTKDNSSYARAKQNSIRKDEDKDKVKKNSSAKQYSANDYNGDDDEDYGEDNEEDSKENHRPKATSYSRNLPEERRQEETSKKERAIKHSARIPIKPNPPVEDTQIVHSLDNTEETSTIKTLSSDDLQEPSDDLQEDEESLEDTEEDTESKEAIAEGEYLSQNTTPKTLSEPNVLTNDSDQYDDELDEDIDGVYNISDAGEDEKPKVEEGDQIKLIAKALIKSPPEAFVDSNSDQEEVTNDQQSSDDKEADTETQLHDLPFTDEIEEDPSLDKPKPVAQTSRYDAGDDEEYDEDEEGEEEDTEPVEAKEEEESKEEPEKSEEKKKGSDYEVTEEPDEGDNPHEKPKPPKPVPIKEKKRYQPSKSYFSKDSSESDESSFSSSMDDDRYEKEFTSPKFFETRHIRPSSFKGRPGYPGYETYILHGAHPHSAGGVSSHFGESGSETDPVVYHRSVHSRRTPNRKQKDVFQKYHDDISEENDEESDSIEDDSDSNDEASSQHEESVEDSNPKLLKLDEVEPSTEPAEAKNLFHHDTTDASVSVESQLSKLPVTEADEGDTPNSSNIPRKREKVKKTKGPIHNKIEIEYTKDDGEDSKVANITLVSSITTERY